MLTEENLYAQDIRGEFCFITEITDNVIKRDGVQISSSRHRGVVTPGSIDSSDVYQRTNVSGYSQAFQTIAGALWTDDLHTRYEAHLRAQ